MLLASQVAEPSPSPREGSSASDGLLLSSTSTDASARHALLDAMCGLLGRVADHRAASVALQGQVSTARSTQYAMRTDLEGLGHGEVALVAFVDMSRQVAHPAVRMKGRGPCCHYEVGDSEANLKRFFKSAMCSCSTCPGVSVVGG